MQFEKEKTQQKDQPTFGQSVHTIYVDKIHRANAKIAERATFWNSQMNK